MPVGLMRALGLALALVVASFGTAQAGGVSGIVVDGLTFRPVKGATVMIPAQNLKAVTDKTGNFRFPKVGAGRIEFRVEADGFDTADQKFKVPKAGLNELVLVIAKTGTAGEIIDIVEQGPPPPKAQGKQDLGRKEITRIPGTRGDALTSIKSLPGVANADAPGSGPGILVIRGAAPEDSKVMLDGIEVPILYHFFGLQSIIPSEFIENIQFLPGGFGVNEGRATGGVIKITTRDEMVKEWDGFAELSFINLAGFIQGPISKKHNLQFSAGLRRSTIDLLLPAVLPDDGSVAFTTAPQYYDGQLRADWRPKYSDHVSLMGFFSFDLLSLANENINPNEPLLVGKWDNETSFSRAILSWRHSGEKFNSRVSTAIGRGSFRFEIGTDRFLRASANSAESRVDVSYKLMPKVKVRAGMDGRLVDVDLEIRFPLPPAEGGGQQPNFSTAPIVEFMESVTGHVAGSYLALDIQPDKKTTITPGVRFDYFHHIDEQTVLPRIAIQRQLTKKLNAQVSLGSYSRPLQQAEAVPTNLKPELATQYVAGVNYKIRKGVSVSSSAFYTDRRQLVVQDPAAGAGDTLDTYVNRGYGRSFGFETIVRAKVDNFFGWVTYTLSRSDRVDGPLTDRRLFDFDQTHNAIVVGSYTYNKWEFGGRFQYSTGNPSTPIIGAIYQSDFNVYLPMFGAINSDRLDANHRIDLRVDRKWKFKTWSLSAYLDIQNVYANPRTLGFTYNYDYSQREAIQEIPILPALGIRGAF